MDANTEISRVAIADRSDRRKLGRLFSAHGLDVVATDPAPGAEDKARANASRRRGPR